jgi:hypothetical protein
MSKGKSKGKGLTPIYTDGHRFFLKDRGKGGLKPGL